MRIGTAQASTANSSLVEEVRKLVPAGAVLAGFAERLAYARDRWPLANLAFREGELPSGLPAVVVQPATYPEVQAVLRFANERRVVVVPYGLGSGVLGGALPVEGAITLDTRRLDRVLRIDGENGLVTVEAGINGGQLETELNRAGVTCGHYPQSINISTVGGWIACRGSGQASSRYGSIEAMVAGLKVVLASGELLEVRPAPRRSSGPGLLDLFVGSEGTLGVIVEATLRAWPVPEFEASMAVVFPDHESGLRALRRIVQAQIRPAVLRLYDEAESSYRLTKHDTHGNRVLCLVAVAGERGVAEAEKAASLAICAHEGAVDIGPEPVDLWKRLRFDSYSARHMAAGRLMDTIEVAAPWTALPALHRAVAAALGRIDAGIHFGAHWSHAYPDGACMYMSLVFPEGPATEQRGKHERAWAAVMGLAHEHGATFAHHHGVGLQRGRWMKDELGDVGLEVLRAVKRALDRNGILNPGKLGLDADA